MWNTNNRRRAFIYSLGAVVSDSDARLGNFRLRGNHFRHHNFICRRDFTFSIPDLNLAPTSASILKAGLLKFWRPTCTGKSKVPSKTGEHGHIPLAQPKSAPILTHLPFPRICQPERQPADTQHRSRSPSWFFHLHKAVNKKPDSVVMFINNLFTCNSHEFCMK